MKTMNVRCGTTCRFTGDSGLHNDRRMAAEGIRRSHRINLRDRKSA